MANGKPLTVRQIEKIEATGKRREISDVGSPGLFLIVQPNGKMSWAWRGRHPVSKKPLKRTLGKYSAFTLADAREWAGQQRLARDRGYDLNDAKAALEAEAEEARRIAKERQVKTLDWYWDSYYDPRYVESLRDKRETRRLYESYLRSPLGSKCIYDIDHDDLAHVVEGVFNRAPAVSNRLLSMIKTMFKRAARELRSVTGLKNSPAENLPKLHAQKSRERWLDDRELGYVMQAIQLLADTKPYVSTYNSIVRLALETGVRITEAREAKWSEFDLNYGTWVIPGDRMKNHRPFLITLPNTVVERLKTAKNENGSSWVFPATRDPKKCFNGVSKAQEVLWTKTREIAAADEYVLERWSAHDLRRSFRTGLRALAHRKTMNHILTGDVLEALLHHVSGPSKLGVAGVYDRYEYADEKRQGLEIWQDHLQSLENGIERV